MPSPPVGRPGPGRRGATGTRIDRLVYALYGLTEEEIKLVEGT